MRMICLMFCSRSSRTDVEDVSSYNSVGVVKAQTNVYVEHIIGTNPLHSCDDGLTNAEVSDLNKICEQAQTLTRSLAGCCVGIDCRHSAERLRGCNCGRSDGEGRGRNGTKKTASYTQNLHIFHASSHTYKNNVCFINIWSSE